MGANESLVDTRPVRDAMVTVGRRTATTDARGMARIRVRGGRRRVRVVAGTTLQPAVVVLRGG
jgi:hypothetical protein